MLYIYIYIFVGQLQILIIEQIKVCKNKETLISKRRPIWTTLEMIPLKRIGYLV